MRAYKRFLVELQDDVTVLHLLEPVPGDPLLARDLRDELIHLVESSKPRKLLIDFSGVHNYPSAAVSGLLSLKNRLADRNSIKFCGMRDHVHLAYRFLNLEGTVFDIYQSAHDALASF